MANSLTLAGIETIGGSTYKLGTGIDFGTIAPDTATISSLLTDGDTVTGDRYPNKTWNVSIVVFGPQGTNVDPVAGRVALSAAKDALLSALSVDSFPVVWTPNGCASGKVMTRGRPTLTVQESLLQNDQLIAQITVSFQTGPFLSSLALQTITVAPTGGPASVQLDGMNSGVFNNATLTTTVKYEGAGSAAVPVSTFTESTGKFYRQSSDPSPFGRSISSTDLSSFAAISVRMQVPNLGFGSPVAFNLTLILSSASGTATYASGTGNPVGLRDSTWNIYYFNLAVPLIETGSFDMTAVTSWGMSLAATIGNFEPVATQSFFDDLRAYPPGSVSNSTLEGAVLNIPAIVGSARTPISLAVSLAGVPQTSGNTLPAADSSFETGSVGDWGFTGNCSLAVASSGFKATHSLQLTATANGNMSAFCPVGSSQIPCNPNTTYTLIGSSHGNTAGRAFALSIFWNDINDVNIAATNVSGTDTTSGFTTALGNVTSPAGAVSYNLAISYTACTAGEVHLLDGVGLIVGASQTWVIGTGATVTVPIPFTNVLLHSPPVDQDSDLAILLGLSAGSDTVPAAKMNYDGTYSVVALFSASATASRTITATFTQEINGSTVAGPTAISVTVSGTKTQVSIGEIALPLVAMPPESANGSLIVAITSTNGTDAFSDVALCDTQGQTILITGLPSTNDGIWVDPPDPLVGVGPIYQSATDRTGAFSAMGNALISGGPILFEPGNNKFIAASTNGAPTVAVSYAPQWLDEAQV